MPCGPTPSPTDGPEALPRRHHRGAPLPRGCRAETRRRADHGPVRLSPAARYWWSRIMTPSEALCASSRASGLPKCPRGLTGSRRSRTWPAHLSRTSSSATRRHRVWTASNSSDALRSADGPPRFVISSELESSVLDAVKVIAEGHGLQLLGAVEKALTPRRLSELLGLYRRPLQPRSRAQASLKVAEVVAPANG